jgi:hypothetical protein
MKEAEGDIAEAADILQEVAVVSCWACVLGLCAGAPCVRAGCEKTGVALAPSKQGARPDGCSVQCSGRGETLRS